MATNQTPPLPAPLCLLCPSPAARACMDCATPLCRDHLTWHEFSVEQFGAFVRSQLKRDHDRVLRSTKGWVT